MLKVSPITNHNQVIEIFPPNTDYVLAQDYSSKEWYIISLAEAEENSSFADHWYQWEIPSKIWGRNKWEDNVNSVMELHYWKHNTTQKVQNLHGIYELA